MGASRFVGAVRTTNRSMRPMGIWRSPGEAEGKSMVRTSLDQVVQPEMTSASAVIPERRSLVML